MKILITQQEHKNPPFFFIQDALERAWYHVLAGHELIPAPNIPNWHFDQIDFDCLVLTGGNDSVARNFTENRLYQMAENAGKPIVGFCHGGFAVNDLAAGINGSIGNNSHIGRNHDVLMDNQTYTVNSYHSQYIAKLGPGFEALATDLEGNPEAFGHIFKPIWGVIWHPERMDKVILPRAVADLLRTPQSSF
jgi:putative glutamine amidotransferase